MRLKETTNKLVNQPYGGSGMAAVNMMFFTLFIIEISGLIAIDVFRKWFTKLFFKLFHHRNSSPWGREINLKLFLRFSRIRMNSDFIGASKFQNHFWEQILSKIEEIFIVSISHIEFTAGILWIVSLVNGLVSKVLSDFENPLKSSYNKLFEIELGCDSHIKFHVEIIMMSDKGSGGGTSWNHIHHWGFDLKEIQLIQVFSYKANNFGSHDECFSSFLVHY